MVKWEARHEMSLDFPRAAGGAAVYRLQPGSDSARNVVEAFDWDGWDGLLPWDVTGAVLRKSDSGIGNPLSGRSRAYVN